MARVRVNGLKPVDEVAHLDRPWLDRVLVEWHRLDERPESLTFEGTEIVCPSEARGRCRLPAVDGLLEWRDTTGRHRLRLRTARKHRPQEAEIHLLRAWSRHVAERAEDGLAIRDVDNLPLFTAGAMLAAFDKTALDDRLTNGGLAALARITSHPRSWTVREHAVLPIERVHRVSRDAERYLDRTAEDTMLVGARVLPGRLLASFVEGQLDIYENRVVVTLVRRLRERAERRLARLEHALVRLGQWQLDLERTSRLRRFHRHGKLRRRGKLDRLAEYTKSAAAIQAGLRTQVRSLTAALATPLGQALRFAPRARSPLKETNILVFDPHYQVAVDLWRALEREEGQRDRLDPLTDDPDAAFRDFCQVALLVGLHEEGFDPLDASEPLDLRVAGGSPGDMELRRGDGWRAVLRPDRDEGLTLELSRRGARQGWVVESTLRIVPTCAVTPDARPGPTRDAETVWLHPVDTVPDDYEEALSRLSFGAAPVRPGGAVPALALPVAPWIHSTPDRVARLLRRFLLWPSFARGALPERCPTCRGPSHEDRRDGDRACNDPQCGTRWGVRTCSGCGATIPKLLPKRPPRDVLDDLVLDAWTGGPRHRLAADLGGRDLLAEPCLHPEGLGGDMLICPSCGSCGRSSCATEECPRCG